MPVSNNSRKTKIWNLKSNCNYCLHFHSIYAENASICHNMSVHDSNRTWYYCTRFGTFHVLWFSALSEFLVFFPFSRVCSVPVIIKQFYVFFYFFREMWSNWEFLTTYLIHSFNPAVLCSCWVARGKMAVQEGVICYETFWCILLYNLYINSVTYLLQNKLMDLSPNYTKVPKPDSEPTLHIYFLSGF